MQARAPYAVADLKELLVPSGTYTPSELTGRNVVSVLDSWLHINSFQSKRHGPLSPFMDNYAFPAPSEGLQDAPKRIFPVRVIRSDGRRKPAMFGLEIEEVRSLSEECCETLHKLQSCPAANGWRRNATGRSELHDLDHQCLAILVCDCVTLPVLTGIQYALFPPICTISTNVCVSYCILNSSAHSETRLHSSDNKGVSARVRWVPALQVLHHDTL